MGNTIVQLRGPFCSGSMVFRDKRTRRKFHRNYERALSVTPISSLATAAQIRVGEGHRDLTSSTNPIPLKHLDSVLKLRAQDGRSTKERSTKERPVFRGGEIKRSVRHSISNWAGVRMQPILKPNTSSITRTRCWTTRSRASALAVGATYRANAPVSRNKSGSRPTKSWAAAIFGSPNSFLTYDGKPSYTVSIMEFAGDKVARETQYFADPFVAPASRASAGRTNRYIILRREGEEMDWKRLIQFVLQGSGELEQYAILLVRVSIGLFFAISGGNQIICRRRHETCLRNARSGQSPVSPPNGLFRGERRVPLRILDGRGFSFEPGLRGLTDRYDCRHLDQCAFDPAEETVTS